MASGLTTNILLSFANKGSQATVLDFAAGEEAPGLAHFQLFDTKNVYHTNQVNSSGPTLSDDAETYDNITHYDDAGLKKDIALNSVNDEGNDHYLKFVNDHFRFINGVDISGNHSLQYDIGGAYAGTDGQPADSSKVDKGTAGTATDVSNVMLDGLKSNRVVLLVDGDSLDDDAAEASSLTLKDLYLNLKAKFMETSSGSAAAKDDIQKDENANIQLEIKEKVAPGFIANASIRLFADENALGVMSNEETIKNDIAEATSDLQTSIFNALVEDYFRKAYNDLVAFKSGNANAAVKDIIIPSANTGRGGDTNIVHETDYWLLDISKCKVFEDVSGNDGDEGDTRGMRLGDRDYIGRFLTYLYSDQQAANRTTAGFADVDGDFHGKGLKDDNTIVLKYLNPNLDMSDDSHADIKFRSMIRKDRFDINHADYAQKDSDEPFAMLDSAGAAATDNNDNYITSVTLGRVGCNEDMFSRLNIDKQNHADYTNYILEDKLGAFNSKFEIELVDNVPRKDANDHALLLKVSGGIRKNGLAHMVGFGYYGYDEPTDKKINDNDALISDTINDRMSFFIRSNIILNLNAITETSEGTDNNSTLLNTLYAANEGKIKDETKVVSNGTNNYYTAKSGGTANANSGLYSTTYNKNGNGVVNESDYASGNKNKHFSVPRGDSIVKNVDSNNTTSSLEFRQNWMLVVTLNSKKQ